MSNRLGGKQGTAYLGTNANQPPNWNFNDRDPNQNDSLNYSLGDLWLNTSNQTVWVLVSLAGDSNSRGMLAEWIQFSSGDDEIETLTASDGTVAVPVDNNITFPDQVISGSGNINSNIISNVNPDGGDEFTINLKPVIELPNTSAVGVVPEVGIIRFGGSRFVHNFGTGNTFLGNAAGNRTLTTGSAINNTGVGFQSLTSLTTGANNTGVGLNALASNTTGNNNVAVGRLALNANTTTGANIAIGSSALSVATSTQNVMIGTSSGALITTGAANTGIGHTALQQIVTGNRNIALGPNSGGSLTLADSDNICIGNAGTGGDNNVMRLGTDGTGSFQVNSTFIAGAITTAQGVTTNGSVTLNSGSIGVLQGSITANGGSGGGNLTIEDNTNTVNDYPIRSIKTRGSSVGAVQVGDNLGSFFCLAGDGTALEETAAINFTVDTGTVSAGRVPGLITFFTHPDSTSNLTQRMYIDSDGVVGISAADGGAYSLVVLGNGGAQITGVYGVSVGGTNAAVLVDNSGFFGTVPSSIRFKENVQDMQEISSPLMKLRPVIFNFKEDENKTIQFGLIAEEVAQVMPGIVNFDEQGQPEGVRYHDLPALLLNEIQKLNKRIEVLEEKLCQNQVS